MLYRELMFISIATNAQRSSIKWILKLLQHASVFLRHPRGVYKFVHRSYEILNDKIQYSSCIGKIIAVCSQIHTNTLCGQKVEMLNVKLVARIVTTGLKVMWLPTVQDRVCGNVLLKNFGNANKCTIPKSMFFFLLFSCYTFRNCRNIQHATRANKYKRTQIVELCICWSYQSFNVP